MQLFTIVSCYDSLHVLLLDKVYNLAAIRNDFQRLAGHDHFLIIKNFPIREPGHYPREDLIEVLVDRRVLIAQLLSLIEQRLAQQVPLDLNRVSDQGLMLVRVILITELIFLFDLLYDAPFAFLGPFLPSFQLLAGAD